MEDDADMDRRSAVRTMLGMGALPLVGACARGAGTRSRLTPRQRAGQRVIFSYPGLTVPAALLRQAQRRSPVASPLLLMTGQEGGLVRRLPGAPALSQKQAGAAADPVAAARSAGAGAGRNLAGAAVRRVTALRGSLH
jgi:beta-N-acetylhexosaminidase